VQRSILLASAIVFFGCSSESSNPPVTATDSGADTFAPVTDTGGVDTNPIVDMGPDLNFPDPFTGCTKDPGPGTVTVTPADGGGDPTGGADKFTLDMALQGFPSGTGVLKAGILTEKGIIVCKFDETKAPVSVANFVGLARGTRPFLKGGVWQVGRFYDGLIWHRVIPGFVIQGGDPRGTGSGGPGYNLPEENHVAEPLGTLAMAAGAEPSGSQFYIVVGSGPAANYNVFGSCETDVADSISGVDTNSKDKPLVDVHMLKVEIARCPM
jgi:peptidyl-prolyl cis-trans isomerase A (cyclophilin A)